MIDLNDPHTRVMIKALIRQLLPFIGGGLALIGMPQASKYLAALVDNYDPVITAVGAIIAGASVVWTILRNTKVATVERADALREVAGVVTKPTVAGRNLAAEVPSPTVVPAGTPAAIEIAKPDAPK